MLMGIMQSHDRVDPQNRVSRGNLIVSCTRFSWTAICPTEDRHGEVAFTRFQALPQEAWLPTQVAGSAVEG